MYRLLQKAVDESMHNVRSTNTSKITCESTLSHTLHDKSIPNTEIPVAWGRSTTSDGLMYQVWKLCVRFVRARGGGEISTWALFVGSRVLKIQSNFPDPLTYRLREVEPNWSRTVGVNLLTCLNQTAVMHCRDGHCRWTVTANMQHKAHLVLRKFTQPLTIMFEESFSFCRTLLGSRASNDST